MQRAGKQPVPEPGGVRVLLQDLGGLLGGDRVGDPLQDVLQGAPGECGSVQEALQDLGRLRGVEPGGVVLPTAGDRSGDGAGGEGLGSSFGGLWVDAAGDRVPHQLGQPRRGAERVEHRDGTRRAVGS